MYNAAKRLPSVIGLLVIFVLMFRWYMKSENLEDLTGYIDEVSDGSTLETVEVEKVRASLVNYDAQVIEGTGVQKCKDVVKDLPGGQKVTQRRCHCEGLVLKYEDEDGNEQTFECPPRSGKCHVGAAHVVKHANGHINASFHGPQRPICHVNGSSAGCHYDRACPKVGDQVRMAKLKYDGSLRCPVGNWNKAKIAITYEVAERVFLFFHRFREKTKIIEKPLPGPALQHFKEGSEVPLYYSRKTGKVYMEDSNVASFLGKLVFVAFLLLAGRTLFVLALLHPIGYKLLDRARCHLHH